MTTKQCEVCGKSFVQQRMAQSVCSYRCAAKFAVIKRKTAKRVDRERKEALKSLSTLASEAQVEVNRYVRYRDFSLGCVSCDKPASWNGQWHASHFRSRGAAPGIRFNLWNIHKACSICNNHLSGNIAEYIPRLRERIGDEKVDWLFTQNHPVKHTREYLKRLKAVFAKKARRLEKRISERST